MSHSLGYRKAVGTAKELGTPLPVDEARESASASEESSEDEAGLKYLRIFTEVDDQKYAVFCEYGVNRKFTCYLVADNEIHLNVTVPVPADGLITHAGFHAVQGPRLQPLDEDFYFKAPADRRFAVVQGEANKSANYYPNNVFPQWVYFVFLLEEMRKDVVVETNVDFLSNLNMMVEKAKSGQQSS